MERRVPEDALVLSPGEAAAVWTPLVRMALNDAPPLPPSLRDEGNETILEKIQTDVIHMDPNHRPEFSFLVDEWGENPVEESGFANPDVAYANLLKVLEDDITLVFDSPAGLDKCCSRLDNLTYVHDVRNVRIRVHMFSDDSFNDMEEATAAGLAECWAGGSSSHGEPQRASNHVQKWMDVFYKHDFLGNGRPIEIVLRRPWVNFKQLSKDTEMLRGGTRSIVVKVHQPTWAGCLGEFYHAITVWTGTCFDSGRY